MPLRAASRPPSRYSAPHSASSASARMDSRRKPPLLSSPGPRTSSSPSCAVAACCARNSPLTMRARRRLRAPSSASGKRSIQILRADQAQHRIAEELQPLIVDAIRAAVCQGHFEPGQLGRLVPERLLEPERAAVRCGSLHLDLLVEMHQQRNIAEYRRDILVVGHARSDGRPRGGFRCPLASGCSMAWTSKVLLERLLQSPRQ